MRSYEILLRLDSYSSKLIPRIREIYQQTKDE